jgi:uncharacterized protein
MHRAKRILDGSRAREQVEDRRARESTPSIPAVVGRRSSKVVEPERTPDGRYVVIDGRRWRASNPELPEADRQALVRELMSARSAGGSAKRRQDAEAERAARERVHAAKVALGERGPKWWDRES